MGNFYEKLVCTDPLTSMELVQTVDPSKKQESYKTNLPHYRQLESRRAVPKPRNQKIIFKRQ